MVDSPVLTLRGVVDYLNVHPNTVYRLAQKGVLPAFKVGSDWRFNRESLDRWRLAQEELLAQRIASQQGSSGALIDEILHVVYWYQAEGLKDSVATAEVGLFVERTATAITRKLNRLVRDGLLGKKKRGSGIRYSLTPQGLARARQMFGGTRAVTAGHASLVEFELQRNEPETASFAEKSSGPNGRTKARS